MICSEQNIFSLRQFLREIRMQSFYSWHLIVMIWMKRWKGLNKKHKRWNICGEVCIRCLPEAEKRRHHFTIPSLSENKISVNVLKISGKKICGTGFRVYLANFFTLSCYRPYPIPLEKIVLENRLHWLDKWGKQKFNMKKRNKCNDYFFNIL